MNGPSQAIKSVTLYQGVERIYNELRERGLDGDSALHESQLAEFDQLHYYGTEAVDEAIHALAISSNDRVLDIGAGFGGPARHLASSTQCQVLAVELQQDMHNTGMYLTKRCQLDGNVKHIHADIHDYGQTLAAAGGVDHIVSWLAFLHIPDNKRLLQLCFDSLRPGGLLFFEDFHEQGPFSEAERSSLANDLYCDELPTLAGVRDNLEAVGFEQIRVDDLTSSWTTFIAHRLDRWREARPRHLRVHGEQIFAWLEQFYAVADHLFAGGNLGGLRAMARKPG